MKMMTGRWGWISLSLSLFSLLQTHFWKSCWIIFSFSQPPILLQYTSHFNGRGEWTVVRPYSSSENQIKSSMPDTKVSKTCVHEWTLQLLSAEMDRLRLSFLERRTRSRWQRSTSSPGQGWIIDMCLCHVNESRPEPHRNQTLERERVAADLHASFAPVRSDRTNWVEISPSSS